MKTMKNIAFALLAIALAASCGGEMRKPIETDGQIAHAPLIRCDIPDVDVIRHGEDYYMVSTSMYFCPGAPIMKSRDLVHWETVGYIFDHLEDDDIYNLRDTCNAYGKGQWATSLRYHDGLFYALFIANDQKKTYVYRTADIENGPWKRSVIDTAMHDASMLFDDGHLYVVYGNGELNIMELEPDGSAVKEGGVSQLLIETPSRGFGLRAEGAHFYKIGDYYYVLEIDWPKRGIRTEKAWRSKNLLGPYESKVILKGTIDGRRKAGVAQGAIFDTPDGSWYAMMFQDHGALGRIPVLQPVTWEDGWPMLGDGGAPVDSFAVDIPASGVEHVWASDEFDSAKLDINWQWNHKPVDEAWSLGERKGWLSLTATGAATGIMDARNTLTMRTVGPNCTATVLLDVSGMAPGGRAGICAFQSHNASIGVDVDEDGDRRIVLRRGDPKKGEKVVKKKAFGGDKVWLRIEYAFDDKKRGQDKAYLSWSEDGTEWHEMGRPLQMLYTLDLFTGYRTALYSYSITGDGGTARFDFFRQVPW